MAPKRAVGDGAALPRAGKRLRVSAAAAAAPGSSIPEPPPSPGKRFLSIVLVVLFFKRPKGRNTDSVPVSLSRIDRLETGLGQVRRDIHDLRGDIHDLRGTFVREQDCIKDMIRAFTSQVGKIIGFYPNHHNNEQLGRQGTNQEGTSAVAQRLATNEGEGRSTNIRLRFLDEMKSPIYHGKEIKSESNESIRVGIFDGNSKIKSGPLSEAKVEIVALEGSFPYDPSDIWTAKEFDEHRASGRCGKGDVLEGEGTSAKLMEGECNIRNIRFREGSCRARKGRFIMAARVCDGQAIGGRIQEAVTKPVVVQDRRNEHNKKCYPPNLNDGVYRLENIAINGEYRKRLKEGITTVEHFLKALHKDEDNLARIMQIEKTCQDWDKMVRHAQQCCLESKPELKSYRCAERNVVIFFNCVHRLVGANIGGCYIASDRFSPRQQVLVDQLKKHAHDQLDGLNGDHVMTNNIPVPIDMDAVAGAGTYCMPRETQQTAPGHQFAVHQVGTPAIEVLSPHAPTEPLCANANNAPGPSSSIPYPHSQHNYQGAAYNSQNFLPAEGLSHDLNGSPCAIANNGSGPSLSAPDGLRTQNHEDQGTRLAGQEQDFSGLYNDTLYTPDAQISYFGAIDMNPFIPHEDYESAVLQHQTDTDNTYVDMQSILWQGNGTFEASTSTHNIMASAHINMALTPQQQTNLADAGAPGAALNVQRQAPLPNNGTAGVSDSAQEALPTQSWSHCQGNMPRNRSP